MMFSWPFASTKKLLADWAMRFSWLMYNWRKAFSWTRAAVNRKENPSRGIGQHEGDSEHQRKTCRHDTRTVKCHTTQPNRIGERGIEFTVVVTRLKGRGSKRGNSRQPGTRRPAPRRPDLAGRHRWIEVPSPPMGLKPLAVRERSDDVRHGRELAGRLTSSHAGGSIVRLVVQGVLVTSAGLPVAVRASLDLQGRRVACIGSHTGEVRTLGGSRLCVHQCRQDGLDLRVRWHRNHLIARAHDLGMGNAVCRDARTRNHMQKATWIRSCVRNPHELDLLRDDVDEILLHVATRRGWLRAHGVG
mmetsp:Transcript_15361/g.48295  ORF Transcript_15361/g.48295 Transcript_15361/m.48295 type:complete len:302 (+) Transcript_15361:453-1358(+)